ncbi:helix-turn-helix domain-containing protein [Luedemannella flava]
MRIDSFKDPARGVDAVHTLADLAGVLRDLRRRHARRSGGAPLSYRELAAAAGWSHGIIGEYLAGRVLPPTDRFDVLVRLLGASPAEQGALATARDRVEETRRQAMAATPAAPVPRQLPGRSAGSPVASGSSPPSTRCSGSRRPGPPRPWSSPPWPAPPGSARPPSRCAGRTASPSGSPTASSTSTCAVTTRTGP